MKQLLILSGKGGTGKTTVASAFVKLLDARAYADCDVDAPNLHLVMELPGDGKSSDYFGMDQAEIDPEKCIACGICKEYCRFDAIQSGKSYKVDPFACEGCGVCQLVCPTGASVLKPAVAGELMLYLDDEKVFSTAQLKMGSGTSGLLVTEVKEQMKSSAQPQTEIAIIDGSPGIGCPVIASLSGVDMVLIVTEPSISGISDMERIIKTAEKFKTGIALCINKYDTNLANSEKIEEFCHSKDLPLIGKVPFDHEAVRAINDGKTIIDVHCPSGTAVRELFVKTIDLLKSKNGGY